MWGRDYVTLALLARDDKSLLELVGGSGSDIDRVRGEWLSYICDSGAHREADEWKRWWRAAGFSVPGDLPAEPGSAAFLLTWNPALYPESKLQPPVDRLKSEGSVEFGWSTGQRREISLGERVYLVAQGDGPRGLVGVGNVVGAVEEMPHWRDDLRAQGKTSRIVPVRWSALATAPFVDRATLISATGEEKAWSSRSGGVQLSPDVAGKLEEFWPAAWERHLHGLGAEHVVRIERKQLIARFNTDRAVEDDSLNISRYVSAFARVMASRALSPPLSIGLFGDWGSGKTFFMNQLREEIKALSGDETESKELYWPNICPIAFNAWHYAETDLWASLVSTIFNELRSYLDQENDDADEFNKVLNRLEIASALREEAQTDLQNAEARVKRANREVRDAESKLRKLEPAKPLSDAQLRNVLSASVDENCGAPLEELRELLNTAAEVSGSPRLKEAAKDLESSAISVERAREVFAETQVLASRAGFWWRILSAAKVYRTCAFWWIVGLAAAIPAAIVYLQTWLQVGLGWFGLLAELLLLGGAATTWVSTRLARASPVFDRLDALQATIEEKIESAKSKDRDDYEERVRTAETTRKNAEEKLASAMANVTAARLEEERAKASLRESTSQARLGRFIQERVGSADYEKHLGLIAMIHRDFQKLSDLMEKQRAEQADPDLPRVDRIILYIDDLDRCYPPTRVVRVLEAVHLLLFFPLFVVVVGVDSRWVSRALNKHYEDMLADESIRAGTPDQEGAQRAPADSQDFLEKIFQVPFWLRKMEPASVRRMINSLISTDEIDSRQPPDPDVPDSNGEGELDDLATLVPAQQASPDPGPSIPLRSPARHVTAEAEAAPKMTDEPDKLPAEGLLITEDEFSFMNEVAPLMPRTPRSVKRFVNIYRLYKAALSAEGLGRFLGTPDRPGNFRSVQVLLALVTGTPQFAKQVIGAIDAVQEAEAENPKRLSDLVESKDLENETWSTTIEALSEFAVGDNDLELKALREVSPLVGRYSVHHMVSQVPGESGLG